MENKLTCKNKTMKKFLHRNNILSICSSSDDDLWSANCIFKFDEEKMALIISTHKETRHAKIMKENYVVSGTMYSKSPFLFLKQGVQYKGQIENLSGSKLEKAKSLYLDKYPLFKSRAHDIWEITLEEIKFTDMRFGRVKKSTWYRDNNSH
ncbi:conserved hypothetical protein [Vibrio nigripulchritudo SOn1]|uniref:Pyridoxamine 5'-phosphate oxidase putative domain-containing protein n=1 Tax=Vibrio nigripulchritudo SOn1 TaxID=1238450 RepID=A0AAV2VT28_9VIBR|nr:pyridoxamine 5'-phosphate oxidase family protein [Vibrio nigripulchritudo]CCO47563.1 conserved hypothetical protein [Vibrio nigripulchritudo SOn1]